MGMMNLKKLIWDQESAEINNFRGNNGIFTVDVFRKDFLVGRFNIRVFKVLDRSTIVLRPEEILNVL